MIKEFLFDCPVQDMSRFIAGLLATAMKTVYTYEEQQIAIYTENLPKLESFILKTQQHNIKQTRNLVKSKVGGWDQNGDSDNPVFSQSENVRVYKMKAITHEIPQLIVMINSFIHFQGSNVFFDNFSFTSQFQRVISSFTDLGKVACLYLLKTGQLLRFLRLLLTQKDQSNQQICEIPLFHVDQNGSFEYLVRNQIEGIDQKVPMIDKKSAQNQFNGQYAFLIRAIHNMVQHCRTGTNEEDSTRAGLYVLDRSEIDLITLEIGNRGWWRSSSLDVPLARNAASKLWAKLCTDDQKLSQIYLKEIFSQISAQNFVTVKKMERPLIDLLTVPDTYQNERITRVLNALYEQMKKNTQYWKQVDSLIELTLKLSRRCRPFAVELYKNKNIVRMIEQITKENPSFPMTQQAVKLFKEGMINWSNLPQSHKNLITEQRVNQISNYSKQRLATLNKVLQEQQTGDGFDESQYVDSDDDCFDIQFKEGDVIDAKFQKQPYMFGWFKAKIAIALDEMVRVEALDSQGRIMQNSGTWIEKDSSKLAKENTQATNDKMVNHNYFVELLRLVEPTSAETPSIATSTMSTSK